MTIRDDAFMADVVEWDVMTWRKAIEAWDAVIDQYLDQFGAARILDVGARNGGTSLFFAAKGLSCVCTDLSLSDKARQLHERYGLQGGVEYAQADCTALPYEDASFDLVAFKSVLGGVGSCNNLQNIQKASAEIFRVLKPGGILLFTENTRASALHRMARRLFVKWGRRWHYMSLGEMQTFLTGYEQYELRTYGFWGAFVKNSKLLHAIDRLVCRKKCSSMHYICYGWARKGSSA